MSDLERGLVGLSVATLKRVCVELCVSSDQILFGEPSQELHRVFEEKCGNLSKKQQMLLLDIAQKYIEAIEAERE